MVIISGINKYEIMIDIKNKIDCCGCNACGDICPNLSISFNKDEEGFMYPTVNKETCINCHLCEQVCPIVNIDSLKKNDFEKPICYAAQNKNLESLFNSTSGSAFAALAEKMYKLGGYVGGAIFNEDYSVTQFISCNKNDLERLRNSKYAQGDSIGFYKRVKELLVSGEKVLVCGLPCQMAALRAFLKKNYENLIVIDLICLGINSPKILRGYLDYKEALHGSKIVYYKAKNKELGWRNLTTKLVFENGDVEYDKANTSYFTTGFISTHAFSRPSCYDCKFKGFPRIADITLGDLWGAEKIVGSDYDQDLGTSVIMINSVKGQKYYDLIKSAFREKEIPFKSILPGNKALVQSQPKPNIDRKQFYRDLNDLKFEEFAKKYIQFSDVQGFKHRLRNIAKFVVLCGKASGFNLLTLCQNIYYNLFCKQVDTNICKGHFLVIFKHCVIQIDKTAKLSVNGIFNFGHKEVIGSKLESRLLMRNGSKMNVTNSTISYGADIVVFKDAELFLDTVSFNVNSTIICGCKIKIDEGVCFGRNVTVRDNNGGHYISRRTFKNVRPVSIGKHSWICEQSTIMPGSKIGAGVIVGACSMVAGKLPNFTLATGNPASVVDEDIFWKR